MKKLNFILLIGLIIYMFTGCGLKTYNSGVLELGPDTYFISANDLNKANAVREAMTLAQNHCLKLGKEILVSERKSTMQGPRDSYEITFMCLNKSDYELKRPKYEDKPNLIIENR